MGPGHGGKEVLGHRIHPSFDPPLNRQVLRHDPVANRFDPLGLQQEMVVDEIHGAVAVLLEVLELGNHMRRAPRPPLAFVENRNVAEHAGPGAPARGLHRREPLHRQHRRHVQRHRLDEVELQTLPVRKGPLIQVALHGAVGVVNHPAVLHPGQAADRLGIVQIRQQIEEELFAVAPTDKIHFRALQLDQGRVQTGEHPAEGELDVLIAGPNLPRQNLGIGIAGRAEKAQSDEIRLFPVDLFDDDVVRRIGIGLIEHDAVMPGLLHDGREGHDADGRKAHDANVAVFCSCLSRKRVELGVANVDEEHPHYDHPNMNGGT